MDYTKGKWHACRKGKCPCKQVWSDNYPVATVLAGDWGDDYPAIRLVGESSLDIKAEAYMEHFTYGKIPEEEAEANALLIAAAPEMYEALKTISAFYSETGYRNVMPSMIEAVRKINKALAKAEGKNDSV